MASEAKDQGRQVATSAKDQSQQALQSASMQTTEVGGATKKRASQKGAKEASARARNRLEEARSTREEHAASTAQWVAENLRRLGEQGVALANGRPQDAADIGDYVRQAADTLLEAAELVDALANDVGSRGIGGLVEDIGGVARRRPGLFVLATAAALAAAVPVADTARPRAEGDREQEGERAWDQLELAALDALLRALWPGDVDERPPGSRRRPPVVSAQKRPRAARRTERVRPGQDQLEEAELTVTGEALPSIRQRVAQIKKTTIGAAGAGKDGARGSRQSGKGRAQEATAHVGDETAEAFRQAKRDARASSGAGKNEAARAKGITRSEAARTTRRAKAPVGASAAAPSRGPARRRAPARDSDR